MATPKRPTDYNQRALQVVLEAVGLRPKQEPDEKDPAAVARGKKGGPKGGAARAAKLTPQERSESARKAARARWQKGSEA